MQFRPPFSPSPSDQSGQQQGFSTQYQVYPQQQQQLYPPQFQPPPVMQPQPPKKKSHKRLWLIISALVVVLVLVFAIGLHGTNVSTTESPRAAAAPTQIPTHVQQFTSQSTKVTTTAVTAANLQNTKPTHGTPTIAGHISDFFGTYGTPLMTNGKDTVWLLSSEGGLSLDARDTGSGVVGYLAVSAPPSWSMQKVQAFCLGFAPHNYTLDKASMTNNMSGLYVYDYDSPSGKFALHVSSGYPRYCYMNTLA